MSDENSEFKKNNGIEAVIQNEKDEEELIDTTKVTLADLIQLFGEEPVRRGLQYMASLEEADKEYKKTNSDELLEGLQDWTDSDDPTEQMIETSDHWSKRMKEEGIGIE